MTSDTTIKLGEVQLKVSESLEQLNAVWNSVNEFLRACQLPVEAWVEVAQTNSDGEPVRHYLGWKKWGKTWQVCYADIPRWREDFDDNSRDVDILSTTANTRHWMLHCLPVFYKGLLEMAVKFADDTAKTAAEVSDRLERFKAELSK